MAAKKGGLGRGLDALFQDNSMEADSGVVTLRLSEIKPNHEQPRKFFDDEALSELAASIREHGVLQPLIVRPLLGFPWRRTRRFVRRHAGWRNAGCRCGRPSRWLRGC